MASSCQHGLSLDCGGFGICLLECSRASNVTAGTQVDQQHPYPEAKASQCGCCSQKRLGQEYWCASGIYTVWETEAGYSGAQNSLAYIARFFLKLACTRDAFLWWDTYLGQAKPWVQSPEKNTSTKKTMKAEEENGLLQDKEDFKETDFANPILDLQPPALGEISPCYLMTQFAVLATSS